MKKTKIQNIILYIINFILIGFIIFSNKGFILNNNRIILKNMSESTQVNDLNKTIETLNNSHTEYANLIQTSKQKIANAINMYPNNNATEQNTLEEFSTMINNLTNIPENTYYYEKGTEGDSSTIKRYKKIGNSYYVCDANGTVADDTMAIDVSSKKLVEYTTSSTENLSAGSASYSNNSLLLGDGTDNAAYYDTGKAENTAHLVLLGTGNNFNVSDIVGAENVSMYSADDFICVPNMQATKNTYSNVDVTNQTALTCVYGISDIVNHVLTYDNTTGDVSISNMTIRCYMELRYVSNNAVFRSSNFTIKITPNVYFLKK